MYKKSNSYGGSRGGSKFGGKPAYKKSGYGGSKSFDSRPPRTAGYGDRPQLFEATCAGCGKECQVPFRPNGSKPVYCRDCFKKEGGDQEPKRYSAPRREPDFGREPSFGGARPAPSQDGARLKAIEEKIDRILDILDDLEITEDEGK